VAASGGGEEGARLRVLACQVAVPAMSGAAERDAHLARLVALIDAELDRRGADLVVLPELASVPYDEHLGARLAALAEPLDGPSCEAFAPLARRHGCHLLFGFPRRAADGIRICQAALGPDGRLAGHYDKIHLAHYGASRERDLFVPGRGLLVLEIGALRLAPIICYDIREPELTRHLTVARGIHLLVHAGAYFRDESFASWHPFVITRAMENQIHLLSLNRAGPGFGHSLYCPPWMDEHHPPLAFGEGEELRHLELGRAEVEAARRDYPFLADRVGVYE